MLTLTNIMQFDIEIWRFDLKKTFKYICITTIQSAVLINPILTQRSVFYSRPCRTTYLLFFLINKEIEEKCYLTLIKIPFDLKSDLYSHLYLYKYKNVCVSLFDCLSVCSRFSRPFGIRLGYILAQMCFLTSKRF